jgi:CBS domain-containing protein
MVKEVMTKKVVSIPLRADFKEAKSLMQKESISALPVTESKEYVGIFTEYDVVMQFYDAGGKLDIHNLEEIMKTPIKTVPSEINIFECQYDHAF